MDSKKEYLTGLKIQNENIKKNFTNMFAAVDTLEKTIEVKMQQVNDDLAFIMKIYNDSLADYRNIVKNLI